MDGDKDEVLGEQVDILRQGGSKEGRKEGV
jgi:hypothetical protein